MLKTSIFPFPKIFLPFQRHTKLLVPQLIIASSLVKSRVLWSGVGFLYERGIPTTEYSERK